jgi:hypothetical protein
MLIYREPPRIKNMVQRLAAHLTLAATETIPPHPPPRPLAEICHMDSALS